MIRLTQNSNTHFLRTVAYILSFGLFFALVGELIPLLF